MVADKSRSVQAVSQSTDLSYLIKVIVTPSDYYDMWAITLQPQQTRDVNGRWNSISLPSYLNHAANEGARYGVVRAELLALASGGGGFTGLSRIITEVYKPSKSLQQPQPVFDEVKDIKRIIMIAHYRDGPFEVATINKDVNPEELRQQVFSRIVELRGFRFTDWHREK